MEYYFAPMEGITGYIYRNAHHAFFPSMDRYYTPFITPKKGKSFTVREWNDILPEHNKGIRVIPQILTNQAEGFLKAAAQLKSLGYEEVNLNLGCPSRTVAAKNKGAGFLAFPKELDLFLEQIVSGCDMRLSVKTRIGKEDPEEFGTLLKIFNKYPLERLIIHPRLQTDYYKNTPNLTVFKGALSDSINPVCYNGDLFTKDRIRDFVRQFPQTDAVMLGRGLLVNPGLAENLTEDTAPDIRRIREFMDRLAKEYAGVLSGERDVLFKMKELWSYLGYLFPDGEKYLKKVRKSQNLAEYRAAAASVFQTYPI